MGPGLRRDDDIGNNVRERGSALIYILIAIALLAALTAAFMGSSNQQTQSQNSFKLVAELQSQIEFIRSTVQECVLTHPGGDITIDITSGGSDPGADRRYPIKPNSSHFTGATTFTPDVTDDFVKNLRCPGNPGDSKEQVGIFGGNTGKFMPPVPPLFDDWQWYNGTDGVFAWISTSKTDAFIQSAFDKLNDGFAACEADVINASGGAVPLDKAPSTVSCAAGKYCFRIWLKTSQTSATYPSEPTCSH
jgi:type II secretory pathway pseudopilin PulG